MIKDIVVNLGLGTHDPAGDYAISVAEAFGAHVLGIAVSYEPVIPGTVMGGIPPEIIESQRSESNQKARTAVSRFEQAVKRTGVSGETPHHQRQHFRRRRPDRPHRPALRPGHRGSTGTAEVIAR